MPKGVYIRTERNKGHLAWNKGKTNIFSKETLTKMSVSKKGKAPWNKGKHLSEETKKKLSESRIGKPLSDTTKMKISVGNRGYIPWNKGKKCPQISKTKKGNTHHTEASRKKMSCSRKGKTFTEEHRHNLSISISKYHADNPMPERIKQKIRSARIGKTSWNKGIPHPIDVRQKISHSNKGHLPPKGAGHGKRCYYNSPLQGEVCFRSSWELEYAKYLDTTGELWYYEIETFDLGNFTYTPDFFLPRLNKFVEIKGYMREDDKTKLELFKTQYPWNIDVLYRNDLKTIGLEL